VFFASANTTYTILVHRAYHGRNEDFQLTIKGSPNYFLWINPSTNTPFEVLDGTVDYTLTLSPRMNIQAVFDDKNVTKSVWVTFDNLRRAFSEKRLPYSVFGDSNGKYYYATISVGRHVVTATPYNSSTCSSTAGPTISNTFDVEGCILQYASYYIADTTFGICCQSIGYRASDVVHSSRMSIGVTPRCGFATGAIRFELRDVNTNQIVQSTTEKTNGPI
jgi:hypothetical protein